MTTSIVIPVFNSEKILPILIEKIKENIKSNYEIILINDFSKDESWRIIKELAVKNNNIKGINLKKNYGQHNAIVAGLNHSIGNNIILMDDDLQHDPIYIKDIIAELNNGYEACYVKYIKRKHIFWKKLVSKLNHITSSILAGKSLDIYASSFKGFNKRICNIIINDKNCEVFLDWLIIHNSENTNSINVNHRERLSGVTNYDIKKLLILWSSMIMSIKSQNIISKFIVIIIKIFIKNILFKIIKKKELSEKFSILEKTF